MASSKKQKHKSVKPNNKLSIGDVKIDKGWPNFEDLYKIVQSWLADHESANGTVSVSEAFDIVSAHIKQELESPNFKDSIGALRDIFDSKKLNEVESSLESFFASLPRQYSFFFYCPQLSHLQLGFQRLNQNFQTIECVSKDKQRILRDIMAKSFGARDDTYKSGIPYGFHFRVTSVGYAKNKSLESASSLALQRFKHLFIGLLVEKRLSTGAPDNPLGRGEGCLYFIDNSNPAAIGKIEISENLRKFLGTIRLPKKEPISNEPGGLLAREKQPSSLLIHASRGFGILLDPLIEGEDVECIRTAAEWLFDAKLNQEDSSLKVMQIAAAAEAVLAEGKKIESQVTKTLSDRCAYLLGYNAKQRENIRKWFSEFYNIRSKLVHGRSRSLLKEDQTMVSWAEGIVESIIKKEMTFLSKDKV